MKGVIILSFDEYLIPGGLPNIVIINNKTGIEEILYAVDINTDNVLVCPIDGRDKLDWIKKCRIVTKSELLNRYKLT